MIIYLIGAFSADKNHIRHKLMHMGMTQHQALCTILLLAVSYIAMNGLLFWWGLPLTHTLNGYTDTMEKMLRRLEQTTWSTARGG